MAIIKKYADSQSTNLNPVPKLSSYSTYINDSDVNSQYFRITEFKNTFTGGKNGFLIAGSEHLKESTEIKIQILDVDGNPIYYEPGNGVPEYYEGVSKVIAVYVYNDTPIGTAKITILGELKTYIDANGSTQPIPDEWKDVYNLKWERTFEVNKSLPNEDKVRFYKRPVVTIDEIIKPIYSNVLSQKIQKGYANGTPLVPPISSSITNYTSPVSYLITTTDDTFWTASVIGTNLTFDDLSYSPLVESLVNTREIIVQTPYIHSTGLVGSLNEIGYTASFNYAEGVDNLKTALTGSFAKIYIGDLTTFIGDCQRVKIFRKSQSSVSDYEFVQEIKLESNELLVDLETTAKNQEYYGIFDSSNYKNYWVTSSNNLAVSFDQSYLFNSLKLSTSTTNEKLHTSKSLNISEGGEYSLEFDVRLESNLSANNYVRAFLSGSRTTTSNGIANTIQVEQDITTITSSDVLIQKQTSLDNVVAEQIDNAKLYFEIKGSGWHLANISFRAAQETSFSPDEITFIQSVPRSLPEETFLYRFEFYQGDNKVIPVLVEATKTFNGGNLQTIRKALKLVPSAGGFQFDSGSNPVPPTIITIEEQKTLLTGSVHYTSQSFDFFGNDLSSSYTGSGQQFPGLLQGIGTANVYMRVQDFTGSRSDINVQLVKLTGECEGYTDTINIYKILDGFGGVNHIIRPYRGTQIRNSSTSSLEIQAVRIDGINDILLGAGAQKNYGNIQLHIISKSLEGVEKFVNLAYATQSKMVVGLTTGSLGTQEINYNATFTRDSIDFRRIVYLMPSSSNAGKFAYEASSSVLASIVLEDLQDGLDSGKVTFNADSFTINPRLDTQFKPVFAFATASFAKRATAGENEFITSSFQVYPSMSINKDYVPEYWMYYHTQSLDPTLTVKAIDDNKLTIPSELPSNSTVRSPLQQTKNLTLTFTYTEPWTSASVSFDKTFTIVPEGKPGDETIIFEINPVSVNLKANARGEVTSYDQSATQIRLKQGSRYLKFQQTRTAGTFYTASNNIAIGSPFWITGSNIMTGSWIDNVPLGSAYDEYLLVGNASKFSDLSGSILYNLEIQPYYTSSVYTASITQNYTKTLDGPEPIQIVILPTSVALKADEVGYVIDENYAAANTKIQVKEGNDFLRFTTQSTAPGTWRINRVETSGSANIWNIRTGSLSSSSLDTATLNFNRFDYPYVSASANYTIQVYPYSLGAGHQYTSSIYNRTQTFTKTVAPPNARKVDFKATSYTVNYNRDGIKTLPEGGIDLIATAFNTTGSVFFYFYYVEQDGSETFYDGPLAETSVGSKEQFITVDGADAAGPGENKTWKVKITDGKSPTYFNLTQDDVRAEGQLTIAGVKAGADSYKIAPTNENVSISGDLWTKNLTGTAIKLPTYKGVTQLTNVNTATYPAYVYPNDYDYLGNVVGKLGYSSASIYYKDTWVTQSAAKIPSSNPAATSDLVDWRGWGINQNASIVYKIDFENGRQTQFVTQSFTVAFTPPAPYSVYMQNENSGVVFRVSGELEFNGTGNVIRVYRGNTELTNKPSGFINPQWDAYEQVGYKEQCRVSISAKSSHITLGGGLGVASYISGTPATMPSIVGWTDPENNLTGEIVYQIECEGRQTLFKTQSLSVQYEGATGPGIVMRGEWSNTTDYIGSVETTNNRRDAVTYLATTDTTKYYAAISGSGPNTYVNPTTSTYYVGATPPVGYNLIGPQYPTVDGNNEYWQYLGMEDFFVAAKIAIFEESYVKNTINVGTKNGTGAFANIVIAGGRTDPYIAIGQNATIGTSGTAGSTLNPGGSVIGYDRPGIFLGIYEQGASGTTGRFSIKNTGGDRYLRWNGSGLEIAGDITVTGGDAATKAGVSGSVASGSYTAIGVSQTALTLFSGSLGGMAAINQINAGNAVTYIGAGCIVTNMVATNLITSTNYSYTAGNFADAGTFIDLGSSTIRTKGFAVDSAGNAYFAGQLSAASGTFAGSLSAATGTFNGSVTVGSGASAITLGGGALIGPGFTLNSSGLSVTNATISGTINASAGSIGNWTVDVDTGNLRDSTSRIFFDPSLPGMAIKESGTTRLKVNYGELTDLGGSAINLSAESLTYYNTYPSSVGVTIDVESTGQTFSVPGGYYVDSSVVWPSVSYVIDAFNRQGYMDLYWGYRIYNGASLVQEVIIDSDWWNGGYDQTFGNFTGYTGTFSFSAPEAASTSYTIKLFFVCQGYQYNTGGSGASFTVDFYAATPVIAAAANVNVVELTNRGIQIASSANRYIKLRREDSAAVPVLDAKGFIQIEGDSSNTPIKITGTTGGTAIDIASGTGQIKTNNNNIDIGSGNLSWTAGSNAGILTQRSGFPTVYLNNLGGAGGGTIRGLEISLTNWYIARNTSARRFKFDIKDWQPEFDLLEAIQKVPIRNYYWEVDKHLENPAKQVGVIAEELEAAGFNDWVDYDWFPKDPENPEGEKEYLTAGIGKTELVFILWKAVQELTKKVKDLENKLNS